jgi:hypothetical protein
VPKTEAEAEAGLSVGDFAPSELTDPPLDIDVDPWNDESGGNGAGPEMFPV